MIKKVCSISVIFMLIVMQGDLFNERGNCQEYFQDLQDVKEEIVLLVGETKGIFVDSPKKVAISNPEIADINSVTKNEIILMGKKRGRTAFSFWDETGKSSYKIKVIPEEIGYLNEGVNKILESLGLSKVYTNPVEDEGKILLLGNVKNVEEKERMKQALGVLSAKVTDLTEIKGEGLIEIAVEILELSKDAQKELGFKTPRSLSLTESGTLPVGSSPQTYLKMLPLVRSAEYGFSLDLLEGQGKARVLSRPRIVCQSGKEAELLVGGEVPVFTTSVTDTGTKSTSVEYKEYGIKLKLTPTLIDKRMIEVILNVDISELGSIDYIGPATDQTAKAYPVLKRTISTKLHLKDGETLAVGGLIKKKSEEDLERFPWLGDIPILGAFFRHKVTKQGGGTGKREDIELFITLTPTIISSQEEPKLEEDEAAWRLKEDFLEMRKDTKIPYYLQDYVLNIQRKILANIFYPSDTIGTGWEGNVILKLSLASTGEVKSVQIVKSSGYKIFDEQALELTKALTYPPFPAHVRLEELNIEIPVVYRAKE